MVQTLTLTPPQRGAFGDSALGWDVPHCASRLVPVPKIFKKLFFSW